MHNDTTARYILICSVNFIYFHITMRAFDVFDTIIKMSFFTFCQIHIFTSFILLKIIPITPINSIIGISFKHIFPYVSCMVPYIHLLFVLCFSVITKKQKDYQTRIFRLFFCLNIDSLICQAFCHIRMV